MIEAEELGPRLMLPKFATVRSAQLSAIELDETGQSETGLSQMEIWKTPA